jgi:hypothetical protein
MTANRNIETKKKRESGSREEANVRQVSDEGAGAGALRILSCAVLTDVHAVPSIFSLPWATNSVGRVRARADLPYKEVARGVHVR